MPKLRKILTALYGSIVALFGLLFVIGSLDLLFVSTMYPNEQGKLNPFLFWDSLLFGVIFLIFGIATIRRPSTWIAYASSGTALYFGSRILAVAIVSNWQWQATYLYDFIAILLCLCPYFINQLTPNSATVEIIPQKDRPA